MHPQTVESLRAALFTSDPFELRPAERWRDIDRDWGDPATFLEPETRPGNGWTRGSRARRRAGPAHQVTY